jgi:hypothetical protein
VPAVEEVERSGVAGRVGVLVSQQRRRGMHGRADAGTVSGEGEHVKARRSGRERGTFSRWRVRGACDVRAGSRSRWVAMGCVQPSPMRSLDGRQPGHPAAAVRCKQPTSGGRTSTPFPVEMMGVLALARRKKRI